MSRLWEVTVTVLVFLLIGLFSGCQLDLNGGASAKIFYKKENQGDVWKSRAAGPSYTSGHGNAVWTWGNAKGTEGN